jgi:hypothetical protein
MSIFFGPLLAGMLPVGAPLDERAHFVAVAKELKFFSADCVIFYQRSEPYHPLPKDWTVAWREARAVIASPHLDVPELLRLLKHKDPKVRTLALAALFHRDDPKLLPHLAALIQDKEQTAPALQPVAYAASANRKAPPPPIVRQTVGQVASRFVGFDSAEKFDAYWAERKDRAFCAGWFLARFSRISNSSNPLDKTGADRVRAIRKDLNRLPAVDRDWTLLWMAGALDTSIGRDGLRYLATPEELLRAGKRLGPERLMALLQGKKISDDPDLEIRRDHRQWPLVLYVLRHGGQWLRPEDADAVLSLEKTFPPTPWCAIAAAELQPNKAPKVLDDAMGRFVGEGSPASWPRAELAAALWRLAGEKEIDYLTDWFYREKVDLNPCTTQTQLFLEGIAGVRAPADRKLAARLIADPRFDKLDYQSLRGLVTTVNRWVKTPLLPSEELYNSRYWRGENVRGLVEWRRKLKESVPAWTK